MTDYRDHYQPLSDDDLALLSDYLDNALDASACAALQARLAREPLLQQALDELQLTCELMRALPDVVPPRSFTLDPAQVSQRSVAGGIWRTNWLMMRFSGALTGLLVVLLTVGGLATLISVPMQQTQQSVAVNYEPMEPATSDQIVAGPPSTAGIAGSPDVAGSSHSTTLLPNVTAADEEAPVAPESAGKAAPQAIPTAMQGLATSDTSSPDTREADVDPTLHTVEQQPIASMPTWVPLTLGSGMLIAAGALLVWLRRRT